MPNVHEIRDHVLLSTTCIDRLYVNGYLPRLQTGGQQLLHFMHDHLGQPIASPALLRPSTTASSSPSKALPGATGSPWSISSVANGKDDIANAYRVRFKGREGVVLIGVAQERARSSGPPNAVGTM